MIDFFNTECLKKIKNKKIIHNDSNLYVLDSNIIFFPDLINEYVEYLNQKLYSLDLSYPRDTLSPYSTKRDKNNEFIINNTLRNGLIETIDLIMRPFSKNDIDLIYSRGYRLKFDSNPYILNNIFAIKKEVETYNNIEIIRYTSVKVPNEYIDKFLNNGCKIIDDLEKKDLIKLTYNNYAVRKAIIYYNQAYLLNYCDVPIDNEILSAYIKQGFNVVDIVHKIDKKIIRDLVLKYDKAEILKYIEFELDEELIEAYFEQGNELNYKNYSFISNPYTITYLLRKTKDKELLENNFLVPSDMDMSYALSFGYKPNKNTNIRNITESFYRDFLKSIELDDNLMELINIIGLDAFFLSYENILKNRDIFKFFNAKEIYNIIKYYYLNKEIDNYNLEKILINNDISILKKIYSIINYSDNFDIKLFSSICTNFYKYYDLFSKLVNLEIDKINISVLYSILNNNYIFENEDLFEACTNQNNYKEILSEIFDKKSKCEDIKEIKNFIFKILFDCSPKDFLQIRETVLYEKNIELLKKSIDDENLNIKLDMYVNIIDEIIQIYNSNDKEYLIEILNKLKNLIYNNEFITIINDLRNLDKIASKFFAIEMKVNLLDLEKQKKGVHVKKSAYKIDSFEYRDELIESTSVDLIDIYNTPFVLLAHQLNAYGTGGTLKSFKSPRDIGKSYICLTAIDETYNTVAPNVGYDIDNVTLLFNDFSTEQYITGSNRDLNSYGSSNSKKVSINDKNISSEPVRDVIRRTTDEKINEYILYREDNQGNRLYPSGILIRNSVPSIEEKKAAAYLGIPLVRIHKKKYTFSKRPKFNKINEVENTDLIDFENLDKIYNVLDDIINIKSQKSKI